MKTGRTHLMDAMPLRMDQELGGWSSQVGQAIERFDSAQQRLCRLAQGGTAVGTGINAPEGFAERVAEDLSQQTGLSLVPNDSFFASLGSQDAAVELSGQLRGFACVVMKIANDLRWMNSGPLAGLGEIELEALQPGSSIMPGKVNPVIPESAAQAAAQVIGLDTAVTVAGQSGNFQLNVMLPLVAANLLTSITLMSNTATLLAERAIATFKVREDNLQGPLARNPILVTALNSVIGYNAAAAIAKKAYQAGRPIIDVAEEETDLDRATLERLLDPAVLTRGGSLSKHHRSGLVQASLGSGLLLFALALRNGSAGFLALFLTGGRSVVLLLARRLIAERRQDGEVVRPEGFQALHVGERKLLTDEHMIQRPAQQRVVGVKGAEEPAAAPGVEHATDPAEQPRGARPGHIVEIARHDGGERLFVDFLAYP